jgi:hypothetical protein
MQYLTLLKREKALFNLEKQKFYFLIHPTTSDFETSLSMKEAHSTDYFLFLEVVNL